MNCIIYFVFLCRMKNCITTYQWDTSDILQMEIEREREREIERDIYVIVSTMRLLINCLILIYILCYSILTILKCAESNIPYFEIPFKQNKKNYNQQSKQVKYRIII